MNSDEARRRRTIAELEPYIDRARSFSGWTFTDVIVRHLEERIPWDYEAMARDHALRARTVVDLGTGGGERFANIIAGRALAQPPQAVDVAQPPPAVSAVATEEWHVNAPVARDRLRPLGVDVVRARVDRGEMPFADSAFDLVLDRHEALDPAEVARVLRPGGRVITQQVGHDSWREIGRFFPMAEFGGDHFSGYQAGFRAAGLIVEEARWHEERVAFEALGGIVYMLMVAPWFVPDFDPVRQVDALIALEDALRTPDGIVLTETHYLLRARKPG
jgi:SAM-dependent methyltransferase